MTEPSERYLRLLEQDARLEFERFGADEAWDVGCRLVALGRERTHPIAIGIRIGAQRVFHAALTGASRNNDLWVERKLATALTFAQSSAAVGEFYRMRGKDFAVHSALDPRRYSAYGGAVPISVGGARVVAVAVSGLAEDDDDALVREALAAYGADRAG